MNKLNQEWLDQMDAQARVKQQAVLNGIAARLNRPRVMEQPNHPYQGAPDFWKQFTLPMEDRVELFSNNWHNVGGQVERLKTMEEVKRKVVEIALNFQARSIIRQHETKLNEMGLEQALPESAVSVWNRDPEADWKAIAATADIGIVMADYAIAHTGTVVAMSSRDKGRSVSLLPPVCILIVPLERLVTRLGEVMVQFDRQEHAPLPTGIHFISGPSRSADIENDLTIGVHGPGVVYAMLVG